MNEQLVGFIVVVACLLVSIAAVLVVMTVIY